MSTIEIKSIKKPTVIDMRIKRNGDVYSVKVIDADGTVIKKQFDDVDEMALDILGHFGIFADDSKYGITFANDKDI